MIGTASTWSLERLDALAAEASALFSARCSMGSLPNSRNSTTPRLKPKPERHNPQTDRPMPGDQTQEQGFAARQQEERRHGIRAKGEASGMKEKVSSKGQKDRSQQGRRKERLSKGRSWGPPVDEAASQNLPGSFSEGSVRETNRHLRQLNGSAQSAVCQYPMQALAAVNDVLFERHGYRRMARHGDPR